MQAKQKVSIRNVVLLFLGIFISMTWFINIGNKSSFTLEDFYEIKEGMSYQEVVSILGGDGDLINQDRNNPKFTYSNYTWNSEYGGYASVSFTNDSVTHKLEHNLKKLDEINR